jgi:hypothetical protein
MINFSDSRSIAFKLLSEIASVSVLNETQKSKLNFSPNVEIWEVSSTIFISDRSKHLITFHMWIKQDFPLTIPNVFLSPFDYEKFKYIPHVNSSRLICTFNSEKSRTDAENPAGIVIESINKAKQIIEDGISGKNRADFEKEFVAYWENTYDSKDNLLKNVLCLIDKLPSKERLQLIILKKSLGSFDYIIHQNDQNSISFKNFLEDYKIDFSESEALFLGDIGLPYLPPFNMSNHDIEKKYQT